MSRPKSVKAPPGARRLIQSLRDLGYDTSTAIADIIDNSINADSSEVKVEIVGKSDSAPAYILIADNGRGMNSDNLKNAMRFGSSQDYNLDDLGKYGLGLKTASLSQCQRLTVASKPRSKPGKRSRLAIAEWDIEHVNKTDDWDLMVPELEHLPKWKQELIREFLPGDGTVVIWESLEEALPLLESSSPKKSEGEAARLADETTEHLRMVFHRFLQGTVRDYRTLKIRINGQESIKPWDPYCREEATRELTPEKFTIASIGGKTKGQNHKVVFQPYVLPHQNEFSSREAHKDATGPRNWNFQQGFYFYRNNRLIQAGGWSNLRSMDEHSKLLRIAVDFNSALDNSFAINVTKMKARIPSEIREQVKELVAKWNRPAQERYRKKKKASGSSKPTSKSRQPLPPVTSTGAKTSAVNVGPVSLVPSNAPTKALAISRAGKAGKINIMVPQNHICSRAFDVTGRDAELQETCLMLYGLMEAMADGKLDPEDAPLELIRRQIGKLV